jgi:hypothetical protein
LNHLGSLRAFRSSDIPNEGPVRRLHPVWTRVFAEDVERAVVVGNRLVGSCPRSAGARGLLVSEPLGQPSGGERIATLAALETWGEVTALAAVPGDDDQAVAVGGVGRVSLVPLVDGTAARPRWDVEVPFRTAGFAWDGGVLWAAGSGLGAAVGDYEWENVRGGGFAAFDPADGRVLVSASLPDDIAWGNGGVPFVVLGGVPCAIARTGELHVLRGDGESAWRRSAPVATSSLGIAHAAVVADRLVYGFNRGGYGLRAVVGPAIRRLAGSAM